LRVKPSSASASKQTAGGGPKASEKRPIQQVSAGFDESAYVEDSDDEEASNGPAATQDSSLAETKSEQVPMEEEQEQEQEQAKAAVEEPAEKKAVAEEPAEKKRKIVTKKKPIVEGDAKV